jgi:EAL and modified HD-GYP domain-containing signal transduction protein
MRVESQETLRQCKEAGFDYFQGYYFARPESLIARVINPSQAIVLQLLDKVRGEANISELELLFKKDVALTFKLLRYINSAGFGLSCEVQSIRHAISILGMQPLYRWLTLLLATAGNSPTAPALMRTAIARGRLCELLGGNIMSKTDRDNLFITGVFSMLDALMDTTMESILDRLVIPEAIADALRDHSGLYGPVLALAIACEAHSDDNIELLADSLMLTPTQVNQAHLDALAWVEQIGLD